MAKQPDPTKQISKLGEAPKTQALEKSSPRETDNALSRLNDMMVEVLGPAQRDHLLGLKSPSPGPVAPLSHHNPSRRAAIESVLERTLARLPARVSSGRIERRWTERFFDSIGLPEEDDDLSLWVELLCQKLTDPTAVPIITLRVLADLPTSLIDRFAIFSGFLISNFVLRLDQDFFDERGLDSDTLLLMEEYGLLRANRDLKKVFSSQAEDSFLTNLLYLDKVLRLTHENPDQPCQFGCYRLTDAGTSLARALNARDRARADTGYMLEVVREARRQGFTVAQADILERVGEFTVRKHTAFFEIVAFPNR